LRNSRARGTDKKYTGAFLRFQKWALCNGLGSRDTLPAKILTVAIYLASFVQTVNSPSPIVSAFYSIKCFHDMYGLISPTESKLVLYVLEASKRLLSKPVKRKEHINVEIINSIYDRLYVENNIKSQRIICAILISYAGFLRSSELLKIRVRDRVFNST
jgi:hypothetical protein